MTTIGVACHNPDRAILVLDRMAEQEPWKAEWARDSVHPWLAALDVQAYRGTIREYVDTPDPDYTLPLVISAVDRIDSRRDIHALPGRILNASTGATSLEITGHAGLGDGPCLYCVYLPDLLGERAHHRGPGPHRVPSESGSGHAGARQ